MNPVNLLFYSPQMTGHPQVYCRVLADLFAEEGHSIVIAGAGAAAEWPATWPDLAPLIGHPRIQFVRVQSRSATGQPALSAEDLRTLQEDFRIDSTLWIDANAWAGELVRLAEKQAPRLRGRTVGIFARTPVGIRAKTTTAERRNRCFPEGRAPASPASRISRGRAGRLQLTCSAPHCCAGGCWMPWW